MSLFTVELAAGEATLMSLAYHSIHNRVGENSGIRALALATSMWVAVGLLSMLSTTPQRVVMTMHWPVP